MKTQFDQHLPDTLAFGQLQTTPEMVAQYAALTSDYNPIHLDADFAANTAFGAPIIHGTMCLNLLIEALHDAFRESFAEIQLDIRFVRPIHVGSKIMAGGKLTDRAARCYEIFVETESGERAVEGTCRLGPPAPSNGSARTSKNKSKDYP